jgi:hypothetical protein
MHGKIISSLAARLYNRKVMDNRERGDYAEQAAQMSAKP